MITVDSLAESGVRNCSYGCEAHLRNDEAAIAHVLEARVDFGGWKTGVTGVRAGYSYYIVTMHDAELPQRGLYLADGQPQPELHATCRVAFLHFNANRYGRLQLPDWWHVAAIQLDGMWHRNAHMTARSIEVDVIF